jgi:hypothetical protein
MVMDAHENANHEHAEPKVGEAQQLRPMLASITGACEYAGNISRSQFYADVLPWVQTVKFGRRRMVVLKSLDDLIAKRAAEEFARMQASAQRAAGALVPATDARAESHAMAEAAARATAERVRAQREPPGAAVRRHTGAPDPPRDL